MIRGLAIIFFLYCTAEAAQSQDIKGSVKDAQTNEALPFANVFLNNTTRGTTTGPDGKFSLTSLSKGYAELVISYVGYQTQSMNILLKEDETLELNVLLKLEMKELQEIQIESKEDKEWKKKFRKFEKEFLGNTPTARKCKIINPWVVDFSINENGLMTAQATAPIEIRNNALGYELSFYLKRFEASAKSFVLLGYAHFKQIEPTDEQQPVTWEKNRLVSYRGSDRHLFRAMIEGRIRAEGFELYTERKQQKEIIRDPLFGQELGKQIIPLSFGMLNAGKQGITRITLIHRIEVHYINDTDHPFYRDIPCRVFWIEPLRPFLEVNSNGVIHDPLAIYTSGYLNLLRVGDMLPFDYEPKR